MKLKLLIFGMLLLVMMSFAGISMNNYTISKGSYQPGEPGLASVTITNPTGSERVDTLTMSINPPYEITVTSTPRLADISGGGSTVVSIPFRIRADANAGIYLLNILFTGYTATTGTSAQSQIANTISIPVIVVREPIFSFAPDKNILIGIDEVNLDVKNSGGLARDVRLKLTGDVALAARNEIYVGDISDHKNISMSLDSRNSADGPKDMIISLTYKNELGESKTEEFKVRMTVKKELLDLSFGQNGDLITRKEDGLGLTIRNNGNTILKNVRLKFSNDSVRLKDRSEINFGDIGIGESKSATQSVIANLPPGLNLVSATIAWTEKDVEKEQTIIVPLTVLSDADVGIYLEAKPSPLLSGQEHTLSVLVSNLGSYPIDNVDVTIDSDTLKSIDVSNSKYIGNLDPDDSSTVQFKIRIGEVSEGNYPIKLSITYRDRSGEWKTKIINKEVNIYRPKSDGFSPIIYLLILAILAAGIWYYKFRKNKIIGA